MRAEFERLLPLMKTGGFIPSVSLLKYVNSKSYR